MGTVHTLHVRPTPRDPAAIVQRMADILKQAIDDIADVETRQLLVDRHTAMQKKIDDITQRAR